ncbi:site-specific integrase [Demequina sp. NBRC 110055]|uniref:tyrosine-type recombinase/integrase n=1 Tax=Demequina sp. NBRC 110055 TaxID=1570344 RepID=UPI000A03C6C4|nr:site-specific integrase [Demequina sp. NBRC 110055]
MSPRRKPQARRDFGAIESLPSGRWRARYTGPDKRQRTAPVTFATKGEADRWLTTVRADMLRGLWTPPEAANITLGEYVASWLTGRAPQLRPRTRDLYARTAERWLLAPVGEGRSVVHLSPVPLRAITPPLVREWHAAVREAAHASAAARKARTDRTHPARAWAREQGMSVAPTGRLSPTVLAAWQAAGSPETVTLAPASDDAGSTATAQAYRLLHAVMAQAVGDGLLTTSPVRIPKAGHVDHAERMPLAPGEVNALADAVAPHYRAAILLAALGGLRPGETFALTRADLNTHDSTVTVRRTLTEIPGQPVTFGPPKTAAGRRTVVLPQVVTDALIIHLTTYTRAAPDALVFTTTTGGPVTAPARTRALRTARQHLGRPDLTWHHLRHTGATLAAQAGGTTAELMHRIGHTSTRAAAIYQHATPARDRELAQRLNTLATG